MELIVFERLGDENLHDEVWLPHPGRPPIDESVGLIGPSGTAFSPGADSARSAGSRSFRLLDPTGHHLGGVYRRLAASAEHRPLLHIAWRQPGYGPRRARHVHVLGWKDALSGARASRFAAGARLAIDGTLRLYRRRFLHLNADLLYYREDPGERSDPGAHSPDPAASADSTEDTVSRAALPAAPDPAPSGEEAAVSVSPLPAAPDPERSASGAPLHTPEAGEGDGSGRARKPGRAVT